MAVNQKEFQPGIILHEVIVGCFKSTGSSLDAWCRANGVHRSTATNSTFGQAGGDKGHALLNRIIDAAGRDLVTVAYQKRIIMEAKRVQGAA